MLKHFVLLAVAVFSVGILPRLSQAQSSPVLGARMGPVAKTAPVGNSALPADAPTRDQVMTLLDQLQVRRNMEAVISQMKAMMKQMAEEEFRKKHPNPTPKQLETLHGFIDDALGELSLDDMINALIPIYQRHLTRTDLEELIRFYGSPVGQKMIREQPQIMQESMQAGVEVQRKHMDEINAKLERRVKEMDADQINSSK